MSIFNIGDIVRRKSYGFDVKFRIDDIIVDSEKKLIILKGVDERLIADSPEDDLVIEEENICSHKESLYLVNDKQ